MVDRSIDRLCHLQWFRLRRATIRGEPAFQPDQHSGSRAFDFGFQRLRSMLDDLESEKQEGSLQCSRLGRIRISEPSAIMETQRHHQCRRSTKMHSWPIQPELALDEKILWAGRPSTSVVFHKEDGWLIPFSLMWGGFAIFWEVSATRHGTSATPQQSPPFFFAMWGIPFVLIGQYLIWGRFLYAAWKKKRTYYAVTNRRVLAVQNSWNRKTASAYIDTLPQLMKERSSGKPGTLRFVQPVGGWPAGRSRIPGMLLSINHGPIFVDIDDVDSVYQLIAAPRAKTTEAEVARILHDRHS